MYISVIIYAVNYVDFLSNNRVDSSFVQAEIMTIRFGNSDLVFLIKIPLNQGVEKAPVYLRKVVVFRLFTVGYSPSDLKELKWVFLLIRSVFPPVKKGKWEQREVKTEGFSSFFPLIFR